MFGKKSKVTTGKNESKRLKRERTYWTVMHISQSSSSSSLSSIVKKQEQSTRTKKRTQTQQVGAQKEISPYFFLAALIYHVPSKTTLIPPSDDPQMIKLNISFPPNFPSTPARIRLSPQQPIEAWR